MATLDDRRIAAIVEQVVQKLSAEGPDGSFDERGPRR